MKLTDKNKKILRYTVVGVLFIAAMTVATLFDFKISSAFTKLSEEPLSITVSSFSVVMEIVGEWPALIFGSFCGAIIIRALNSTKKTKAYISSAFVVLVIFGLMFYGSVSTAKHISGKIGSAALPVCIAVSAISVLIILFSVMKISEEKAADFLVPAIICAVVLAALFLGIQVIKSIFGRIRMRELVKMGDLSLFTPWYKPRFFSGSHSFPSGHTANAVILALIPIFYGDARDESLKKVRFLTYAIVAAWALTMALTRINAGAHYMSDVLVGAMLAFIAVEAGNYVWTRVCEEPLTE